MNDYMDKHTPEPAGPSSGCHRELNTCPLKRRVSLDHWPAEPLISFFDSITICPVATVSSLVSDSSASIW
jgi:hypothetical protein